MLINFADKVVIGIAGVPIMRELNLSPRQFGLIGSSFFLLFSVSAVVTGFVVNRVHTRSVLLIMALTWALMQFPMIGTVGFTTLVACRITLGAAEGPAYPVALHAAYKWFPDELRTLPTAIFGSGGGIGPIVALPLLNWVIVNYSWHWAFGALGVVGLAWTTAWLILGEGGSVVDNSPAGVAVTARRLPYRRLLLNPTIAASWCAAFSAYWGVSVVLTWWPGYLINGLGFAQNRIGLLSTLPWAAGVIAVIIGGWYSQRLRTRGVSSRRARGLFGGVCVMLGGAALLSVPYLPSGALKIAVMAIGMSLPSVIFVVWPAIVSEITPLAQRGALLAIGNAIATSAGVLAPYVMGSVIEKAPTPIAGFDNGFAICGVIIVAGGMIGIALMRPEREALRLAGGQRLTPAC